MFHRYWVGDVSGVDVLVKFFGVDDCSAAEGNGVKLSGAEGGGKLFVSKNGAEVVWVDCSVVATSLFRVDVPTSCQGVGLGAKLAGVEVNDKVELAEVLGPSSLSAVEELGRCEIFEVLVIGDDVNRRRGTFKVVTPNAESFEDCVEFFVVDVIVELGRIELARMESHRMDLS